MYLSLFKDLIAVSHDCYGGPEHVDQGQGPTEQKHAAEEQEGTNVVEKCTLASTQKFAVNSTSAAAIFETIHPENTGVPTIYVTSPDGAGMPLADTTDRSWSGRGAVCTSLAHQDRKDMVASETSENDQRSQEERACGTLEQTDKNMSSFEATGWDLTIFTSSNQIARTSLSQNSIEPESSSFISTSIAPLSNVAATSPNFGAEDQFLSQVEAKMNFCREQRKQNNPRMGRLWSTSQVGPSDYPFRFRRQSEKHRGESQTRQFAGSRTSNNMMEWRVPVAI
ncbi:hypothetical protein BDZ91DRAFT_732671 [Kalaharituber pfeilii]|nr:hypothetical protein BDZ91DRAFT_732671 [Kalaharituber pfeilii]